MQVDIRKYTDRVLESYTAIHRDELDVDPLKMKKFSDVISQIDCLIDDHTIGEYEVDIVNNDGLAIRVTIDIGYFEEEVESSCFLQLLRKCQQFEIHPGELSKIVFQFEGVWRNR